MAAAGLDSLDPVGLKGLVADQELGILPGEDVVGYGCETEALPQFLAERKQQGCLAAADRSTNPDGEGATAVISAGRRQLALIKISRVLHVLVRVSMPGVIMGMGMVMAIGVFVAV